MAVVINDQTYYRTTEVCQMIGISRNTLFGRIKEGKFSTSSNRGWGLFTAAEIETIRTKASPVTAINRKS